MWLNTPASELTETSILYTDGYTDGQTHGRTDRLIPVYPPENIDFAGIIKWTDLEIRKSIFLLHVEHKKFPSLSTIDRGSIKTVCNMYCNCVYKNQLAYLFL